MCERLGVFSSVIAFKGAVLGPKTIPRRTLKLVEEHGEEVFWKVHKENPEKVYGVEIEI